MKAALFQVACVAIPKALGGVIALGINALLMHHIGPAEFGVYAVCLTLTALADGVLGSAIDMSVVKLASAARVAHPARALAYERVGLLIKLALTAAALLLATLLAQPLSEGLFHRDDAPLLLMALAGSAGVLLLRSTFLHLQLSQRFGWYAILESVAQALRVAGAAVAVWVLTPSAGTLIGAGLVGNGLALLLGVALAPALWLMWLARRPHHSGAVSAGTARTDGAARELIRTLPWILLTFAFSAAITRIDLLLLAQWSTMEQAGIYAAGQVFAQIPELLGTYLAVVMSPKVAPATQQGRLPTLLSRVQKPLLLAALALGACALLSIELARGWLPAEYAASAGVFMLLLAGSLAAMCAFPLVIPFVMFTKPRFIFQLDLATLPFILLAYAWAIPRFGAIGAAWVTGVSRLAKLGILQACAWAWARQDPPPAPAAPSAAS